MEWDIKKNNRKRLKLDIKRMGYFVGLLGIVCAGMVMRQAYWYYSLLDEYEQSSYRVELLRQKKQKLQEEKAALGNLDRVEKVARENYNMVKKNEIPVFILEEKEGKK